MRGSLSIVLILFSTCLFAQRISGTVKDNESSGLLPGAHIRIEGFHQVIATDASGYYQTALLKEGSYLLISSFIGYKEDTIQVEVKGNSENKVDFSLERMAVMTDEFVVMSTRAPEGAPLAVTNINSEEIEKQNLGQDLPMILNWTPSIVTTSDAGSGVGYTGMRIRGSDPTRINVTVNGIPVNDAESQGVFWVNMPDFASSTENIQIQRGVGTSSNGAASFGASVNLQSTTFSDKAYGELSNSYGSFETRKHTVKFGSGLVDNKWVFDGRLSQVKSDGYIDRAASDLKSYYLSGGYYGKKTVIKAITFSGTEHTYQSWYGTPESRLEGDVDAMNTHADNNGYTEVQRENLLNSGRTYNYYLYNDETDNYQQDHYQLHFSHQVNERLNVNAALHYTYGRGYFEQFRENDELATYGIMPIIFGNDTVTNSDLIRRRWLDNDFYGVTYSLIHRKGKFETTVGGAYNEYKGDHFGELTWARFSGNSAIRDKFYDNDAMKTDLNFYVKSVFAWGKRVSLFGDVQNRIINYKTEGVDIDQRDIAINESFNFINPKAGIGIKVSSKDQVYASFSTGNREPVRNDFIDAPEGKKPSAETMFDYETGYRRMARDYHFNLNLYYMDYHNQLVLTGELNDVGSSLRTNVDKSYRAGVEAEFGWQPIKSVSWRANFTYSQNKIKRFKEVIYDYTNDFDVISISHTDKDIAYSPSIISGSMLLFKPVKSLEIGLLSKYVGEQFLDNTSNKARKLDAYLVNDARVTYTIKGKLFREVVFSFLVNNVFDEAYSSNGYTYTYIYATSITENFYYPQADRNYLAGLTLKF